MKFAFDIKDMDIIAPGIDDINSFYEDIEHFDETQVVAKSKLIAMMTARRLTIGTRLACEVAIRLLNLHSDVNSVVFASRHGELVRNYSILSAIASNNDVSPTEFATSVHNSAVGHFTILTQKQIVSSSVSAGYDSFVQGLIETLSTIQKGQKAIFVDFDGAVPEFYNDEIGNVSNFSYAAGFIIEPGESITISSTDMINPTVTDNTKALPQSFEFLKNIKNHNPFMLEGNSYMWQVQCNV